MSFCDRCPNRREFLASSAVFAAALLSESCGNGVFGPPLPTDRSRGNLPPGGPVTVKVASIPGLQTEGTLVDIGQERAVMRTGSASFLALSMICTHQQCVVAILNNAFACPCHGSEYDRNGNVTHGPATQSLVRLEASYDPATDELTVA